VSSDVIEDDIESAGVDVGDLVTTPLARASASDKADRYEAAEDGVGEDDFLNKDDEDDLRFNAIGDGKGEPSGIVFHSLTSDASTNK
jgi:hypothetical protein